ncbi:hypothetical protein LP52_18075 [Streptomonospora alba]|uniref:Uncharacterized protein n=1 Tax=Streptomonospora alba TaxID=183763 RepID=A0A0C2G2T7_9ACTN|nr:hypothetical protein [Streptomonospora alba]KIH97618.1 hypothetical protein LP52_18075 [Streptomonospora alba]
MARLRWRYPHWDIRYYAATSLPERGVFVASIAPAPECLRGVLTAAASSEEGLLQQLEIHDRVARHISEAANTGTRALATDEEAVAGLQGQHPHWRIRYETDPGDGRLVATRSLTPAQAALGLLETVTADDATELAHRLAYQDALAAGADAITLALAPHDDLAEDAADLIAGCEALLHRTADGT